ncbi:MAG: hypothetical protein LBQ56_03915 [Synergistaceae bacterium]|jgi:hypothetical protein|nr:hypothetical protein [Synergistaceae bacterium]
MNLLMSIGYKSFGFAVLKGALGGLAAGAVIVAVMGRLGLFKRDGKFRSAAVKLFYLYIPVVTALILAAWSAVSSARTEAVSILVQFRPDLASLSVSVAESANDKIIGMTGAEGLEGIGLPQMAMIISNSVDEALSSKLQDYPNLLALPKPIRYVISEMLVEYVSDILVRKLAESAESIGLSSKRFEGVMATGIIASLQGGLLADIAEIQLTRIFDGFHGKVRAAGIVLALPVLIEVGLSLRGRRKRRLAQAA